MEKLVEDSRRGSEVVKAYQYSYITSVTFLDCFTVVWVIILTWYVLGTRYSLWQFVGAGACVAGLALALLSDAKSPDEQDPGKIPLLGDALVIAGTVCFAFNNVGQEYCVKNKDRVEVVAMLGLFGSLMSGATLFNLSLLTSDMWAVTIQILFYHQQFIPVPLLSQAEYSSTKLQYALDTKASRNARVE
ncbi:hypothetical protein C2845_PM05G36420 [Panicum miliaceum]|uniref:Solute carrier family 35 member F2-like n=1 Tax=Panicum miliaceum TaxID=4540 RepID=A0A3L6T3Y5_PANMI|nr:hypothetical protein C2845_PM05G36420 [Panicum miliaceum]